MIKDELRVSLSRCGMVMVILLGLQRLALGQSHYYRHSIFDNSLTSDNYFYSSGSMSGHSLLHLQDGKLPVDTLHFYSPPNALQMEWVSGKTGSWETDIKVNRWRNRNPKLKGTFLSFWCYSPDKIKALNLPLVGFIAAGDSTRLRPMSPSQNSVAAGRWRHFLIPLKNWPSLSDTTHLHKISRIRFAGSPGDNGHHKLILDQLKIFSPDTTDHQSPAAPHKLTTHGYARHIDLKWKDAPDKDLSYYQIYRSVQGGDFKPVGIQRASVHRYADYIGRTGEKVSYKIKSVDQNAHTSGWSEMVTDSTVHLSDNQLLTMVQRAGFRYYWEGANAESGMARENIPGNINLIATGASGFGIMALVVGIHRGFITRQQGADRLAKIIRFLKKADRFHGVWPHFIDGRTGKVIPLFGKYDDGGDLVETAFLMQGLLVARQFFDHRDKQERKIRKTITHLWKTVEWDWYRKNEDSPFLYWHWSPDYGWHINHPLIGWNETMMAYLLAIASPTHAVPAAMYYSGWASRSQRAAQYRQDWGHTTAGNHYKNGHSYNGINLDVGVGEGGPLFFTQYSFMGFDPRGKQDRFTKYFQNNRQIALINHAYSVKNPENYVAYGDSSWGLTASDGPWGYVAHEPKPAKDEGTITPTGAIASFPYTPKLSMKALKYFYRQYGDRLWGIYGFKDAFNPTYNWYARIYMGLNQAPMTVMIENYRSGFIWKLFMANPEIEKMLYKIGFQEKK